MVREAQQEEAPSHFDRRGNPISQDEWIRLSRDVTYPIVRTETLPNGYHVKTVWSGVYNSTSLGKPRIFKTIVLSGHPVELVDVYTYVTEEESLAGHALAVERWSRGP